MTTTHSFFSTTRWSGSFSTGTGADASWVANRKDKQKISAGYVFTFIIPGARLGEGHRRYRTGRSGLMRLTLGISRVISDRRFHSTRAGRVRALPPSLPATESVP